MALGAAAKAAACSEACMAGTSSLATVQAMGPVTGQVRHLSGGTNGRGLDDGLRSTGRVRWCALVAQWHSWPMVWHRSEAAGGEQVRRHCGGCRIAEVEGPAMRKEEEVGDKKKEEES